MDAHRLPVAHGDFCPKTKHEECEVLFEIFFVVGRLLCFERMRWCAENDVVATEIPAGAGVREQ